MALATSFPKEPGKPGTGSGLPQNVKRWRGVFGKPQERQLKTEVFDGNDTKASGKQAQKGRGWISQAIKGLWELLCGVVKSQPRKW